LDIEKKAKTVIMLFYKSKKEKYRMDTLFARLRFLGSEIVLGLLIAILSVFAAYASYQGSMADSDQNKYEIQGMKALNDGNAEYLSGNQTWIQDDGNYDNWYINQDSNPDLAAYYEGNFTEEMAAAIERNGTDEYPVDDAYVEAIYADANTYWQESDDAFALASQWDERGDSLQLVVLVMALGLAFAAWASLLSEESKLRVMFAIFSIVMLVYGVITYVTIPAIAS
jgi:hypothetical protein